MPYRVIKMNEQLSLQTNVNLSKTLGSLAILKTHWNGNQDFLDTYIDFIATLIQNRGYHTIEIHRICNDFYDEFGLKIPYLPMISILNKCVQSGIIEKHKHENVFRPVHEKVLEVDFIHKSQEHIRNLEYLINRFIDFTKEHQHELSYDKAEETIISFLREYNIDLIINNNKSVLPPVHTKTQEMFLFYKFVQSCHKENHDLFSMIIQLSIGSVLANALLFDEIEQFNGGLDGLQIYLDTPFIFRLLGLDGIERKNAYEEFISALTSQGATLHVFTHTFDEIKYILDDCERWIESIDYDPLKASNALMYFVENGMKKADVITFKLGLDKKMEQYGINKVETPDFNKDREHTIDEKRLFDLIVEKYSERPSFNVQEKEHSLLHDVKSISSIYKLRANIRSTSLNEAKFIFLTTNTTLAYVNRKFEEELLGPQSKGVIHPCVTDVFLGTICWLQQPALVETLNEKKIIADCVAALRPNEILIKKFTTELEKLRSEGDITSNEYYFLRTHSVAMNLLADKTLGDPDSFRDMTSKEIYEEIKEVIRKKEQEIAQEKLLEQQKKNEIITKQNEELSKESSELQQTVSKLHGNFGKISDSLSKTISITIIALLISIFIIGTIAQFLKIPLLIDNPILKVIIIGIAILCGVASVVTGFNIKSFRNSLERRVREFIIRILYKLFLK